MYSVNVTRLKIELEAMTDRDERAQQIESIVSGVTEAMEKYFTSDGEKTALEAELGLDGETLINLTADDWVKIKGWLIYNKENTMHFGQSAFLVIKELVDDYYKDHPEAANACETGMERYVRIAKNVILIDILAGAINPFTKDDLLLSLYGLSKAAKIEGLELDAYKLTWDDLVDRVADYKSGTGEKVMAHMNSNHFVMVTSIDAENRITYYEPNMGKTGESVTISKDEFMKIWEGYSLSARAPPEAAKKLSAIEAQRIRGANVFLIISVICSVISFALSFIDNEFCQILSKILAVVAVVCAGIEILSSLPTIFSNLTSTLGGVKDLFVSTFENIGNWFSNTLPNFVNNTLNLSNINIAQSVVRTVISIPTSISIMRGLEFMGVDPGLARIAASFVSGGMIGSFNNGFTLFDFGGAFGGVAAQGLNELGAIFGVDKNITSVISTAAGALVHTAITRS